MSRDLIREALVAHLRADAGVAALVGARLYPMTLPEKAVYPAVAYQRIDPQRGHAKDGPTGETDSRFQFSCWAERMEQATEVADAIRAALAGFKGTLSGIRIADIREADEADLHDPDGQVYGVAVDFIVLH